MTLVLIVIATLLLFFMCKFLWTWMFIPQKRGVRSKSRKRAQASQKKISDIEEQNRTKKLVAFVNMLRNVPLIGFSSSREQQLKRLITATDLKGKTGRIMLPQELYFKQFGNGAYVFSFAVICAIMFQSPMLILAGMIGIIIAAKLVTDPLTETERQASIALSSELFDIYKLYYVQYIRRDATGTLSQIMHSYMPKASPDVQLVLSRFISDLESGDDYGLRKLDERFRDNPRVHKLVSVIRSRSKGDDAAFDNMRSFFLEMQEQRDNFFDVELKRRESRLHSLVNAYLASALCIIMVIQFMGMMKI